MRKCLLLLIWVLFFVSACEPVEPTAPGSFAHPGARMWASMVYEPLSAKIILFGGGRLSDTWTLDLARRNWTELAADNQPVLQRMGGVGAAYDTRAERIIVFIYKGAGLPGETWALDYHNGAWQNLHPANAPASRRFTTLVYNQQADKTILFGGVLGDDSSSPTNELWVYDYPTNSWSQRQAASSPPPSYYLHAVYDAESSQVLLWGGKTAHPEQTVWAYDFQTNAWTKTAYRDGPNPDYDGTMVYAPGLNCVFLYVAEQFWSYDARQQRWEKLPVAGGPGRQYGAALAYDEGNHRLVLFGGTASHGDTWLYDPDTRQWTVMTSIVNP